MKGHSSQQIRTLQYTIPAPPAVHTSPVPPSSPVQAPSPNAPASLKSATDIRKKQTAAASQGASSKKQIFVVGGSIILAVIVIAVIAVVAAVVVTNKKESSNTTPLPVNPEPFPLPATRTPEPVTSAPIPLTPAPQPITSTPPSPLATASPPPGISTSEPHSFDPPTDPDREEACEAHTSNEGVSGLNDACERAFLLTTDSSLVCGTIVNENSLSNVPVGCTVIRGSQGPPVWYLLQGTGERITITTCSSRTNFDTVLAVFDNAICDHSSCQGSILHGPTSIHQSATNDNDITCTLTGSGASTVTFDSAVGQMYKLYVSEKLGSNGGNFGLKATSMKPPVNDRCESAIRLNTDNVEIIGSTINATIDWQVNPSCAFTYQNIRGASVWYTLEGTGERITITTCSRNTDIDTVLAVYSSAVCNQYDCQGSILHGANSIHQNAASDDDRTCLETGSGASTVTFDSVLGQMYKLYVSEKYSRSGGTFGLKATSMKPPVNDRCESAIRLNTDNVEIIGSTINATIDWQVNPSCAFTYQNIRGASVWYTLEGTGERITVTTCSRNTDIDTVLAVYSSAVCNQYDCQGSILHGANSIHQNAASDDDRTCLETGSGASTVTFDSVLGQMYKLYVSEKYSRSGGTFGLKATSMKPPVNDRCESAIRLNTDNVEIIGSTINATIDWQVNPSCAFTYQNIRGASVWYTLEGTGERITITTCSRNTDIDTVLAVYSSAVCNQYDCQGSILHGANSIHQNAASDDDRTCLETGSGASTVTFDSVLGQMYKLYVSEKYSRSGGTFGLKATSMKPPVNDRCESAIRLNTDNVEIIGSTINATIDWQVNPSCAFTYQNIRGASVWYTLEGTGERITITTCSRNTDIDTVLAVYSSAVCNQYDCQGSILHGANSIHQNAASDDDRTCLETGSGASTVTFDSVLGQMYKLYVSEKYSRSGGTFGLKATSMKPPVNDRCESAIRLNTDNVEIIGSTINATIDWQVNPSCAFTYQNIRGASVWYTLEGTGERITITTCSRNTNIDTVLAVYSDGNCASFQCLVSNDNDNNCPETGVGASTVTFDSVVGQMYKLYVSEKYARAGGTFGLKAMVV